MFSKQFSRKCFFLSDCEINFPLPRCIKLGRKKIIAGRQNIGRKNYYCAEKKIIGRAENIKYKKENNNYRAENDYWAGGKY